MSTQPPDSPLSDIGRRCAEMRVMARAARWRVSVVFGVVGLLVGFPLAVSVGAAARGAPASLTWFGAALADWLSSKPGLISVAIGTGLCTGAWLGIPWITKLVYGRRISSRTQRDAADLRWERFVATRMSLADISPQIGAVAVVALIALKRGIHAAAPMAALALVVWGAVLIGRALTHRGVWPLVCARCEYPLRSFRSAPVTCPECGCRWREHWGLACGPRRVHRARLAWGAGLLGAATAIFVAALVWGR